MVALLPALVFPMLMALAATGPARLSPNLPDGQVAAPFLARPTATASSEASTSDATHEPTLTPATAPAAAQNLTSTPPPTFAPGTALPPATSRPIPQLTPKPNPTPEPSPTPEPNPTSTPPSAIVGGSTPTRLVVVWMENEEAAAITASSMPYLYGLSIQYGRATQMYAVTHPSQPNYLAFWSGSTQGVVDNANHDLTAPTLASQVTAAGKQWRVYAQNVPGNCFTGSSASGPVDGWGAAGTYARKHEPAISFTDVQGSPTECAKIQPLAAFSPTAFDVAFVAPNLCNDMHDCSLATGDAFLQAFLPQVFNSPDWAHTMLIVTFDEGTSGAQGGGNVFMMVARQGLSGFTSSATHTHYGVLRTIENLLGVPCLANACSATPLTEFLP